MATATVVVAPRILTTTNGVHCSALPYLSPRISPTITTTLFLPSLKHLQGSRKSSLIQIRASSEETSTSADANELITDLKEKWDAVENKSTVLLYGGGAVVFVWVSSILVGAINSVPLLPKILELVGLGYTGWFVYRYLLFKSSRKELATDIEALKKKIAGTE
ncbi:putative cyanobacterial aminoacyl-tRNA synthetase, CAAD domain, protein CURVATURE THYLAKOID 1 [Lupinus albus]|uniref:Putative cyanobacterial aminoacyl-tRNA synthetase, CAAD domain, protein CURVATURE THYLAKOID 1 n=1 Tax=Lupinus albus TaxID=3870 RepID=A0A6A4NZQ2_LUPAL|nr:putative cyanobacterial aminoacyl-tRNA synthetase, CAAD domain, protein CURVATURE THYLAKOID 1 [Lupinus albus]